MFKKFIAAVVVTASFALPASAVTIIPSISSPSPETETYTFGPGVETVSDIETQGSLFKSVMAYNGFDAEAGVGVGEKGLFLGRKGMGVTAGNGFEEVQGSRLGFGEALVLEFNRTVQISTFDLRSKIGTDQSFKLYIDGVSVSTTQPTSNLTATLATESFDFSGDKIVGTTFAIIGTNHDEDYNGFWLKSISIEPHAPIAPTPNPVPLPATAPLLAGALAFGAMMLRRRRKT